MSSVSGKLGPAAAEQVMWEWRTRRARSGGPRGAMGRQEAPQGRVGGGSSDCRMRSSCIGGGREGVSWHGWHDMQCMKHGVMHGLTHVVGGEVEWSCAHRAGVGAAEKGKS